MIRKKIKEEAVNNQSVMAKAVPPKPGSEAHTISEQEWLQQQQAQFAGEMNSPTPTAPPLPALTPTLVPIPDFTYRERFIQNNIPITTLSQQESQFNQLFLDTVGSPLADINNVLTVRSTQLSEQHASIGRALAAITDTLTETGAPPAVIPLLAETAGKLRLLERESASIRNISSNINMYISFTEAHPSSPAQIIARDTQDFAALTGHINRNVLTTRLTQIDSGISQLVQASVQLIGVIFI